MRSHRPDARSCAGGPETLLRSRRDGDRRECAADYRLNRLEEARRGAARSYDHGRLRFRRIYADARGRAPARDLYGRGRGAGRCSECHVAYRSRSGAGRVRRQCGCGAGNGRFPSRRHRDSRVLDLVLSVVAEMVALAGVERDPRRPGAWRRRRDWRTAQLRSTSGAWSRLHGWPEPILSKGRLPISPRRRLCGPSSRRPRALFPAWTPGAIGHALVELGGGRKHPDGEIDLSVGFTAFAPVRPKSRAKRRLPSCMRVTNAGL